MAVLTAGQVALGLYTLTTFGVCRRASTAAASAHARLRAVR